MSIFFLLTLGSRFPLLHAPYYYDDVVTIQQNTLLRSFRHLPDFFRGEVDSGHEMNGSYRPLLLSVDALWGHLTGFSAVGWRLLGFLLHAINGLLIFFWGTEIFRLSKRMAGLVVLGFLLHPIQNTSLALIWKQSDLWAALFVLLTGLLWFRNKPGESIVLFIVGLGFKESVVIAPAVWFLLEMFTKPQRPKRTLALSMGLISLLYLRILPHLMPPAKIMSDGNPYSPLQYFWTQLHVLPMYFRALFMPSMLTLDRGIPVAEAAGPFEVTGMILVLLIFVATWLSFRRQALWGLALLLSIVWLIPTSSFKVLSLLYDETRMYAVLGFLGLGIAVCFQRAYLSHRWKQGVITLFILVGFSANAYDMRRWSSEEAVWTRVVQVDPCSSRGQSELAGAYENMRAYDDAERHYRLALSCTSSLPQASIGLGRVLGKKGNLEEAETVFQNLRADPYWMAQASYHLGLAKMYRGDQTGAKTYYLRSHHESPSQGLCEKGMALLLKKLVTSCDSLSAIE